MDEGYKAYSDADIEAANAAARAIIDEERQFEIEQREKELQRKQQEEEMEKRIYKKAQDMIDKQQQEIDNLHKELASLKSAVDDYFKNQLAQDQLTNFGHSKNKNDDVIFERSVKVPMPIRHKSSKRATIKDGRKAEILLQQQLQTKVQIQVPRGLRVRKVRRRLKKKFSLSICGNRSKNS